VRQFMRVFARSIIGVVLSVCAITPVHAQTSPEVTHGLQWLAAQVQVDGSLLNESQSIATPLQNRTEAAQALKLLATLPGSLTNIISGETEDNTEYLARRIMSLAAAGQNVSAMLSQLTAGQNADGGFGGAASYNSNALDTSWALLAMSVAGQTTQASAALDYLKSVQQADGSFIAGHGADIYTSAYALAAMRFYASAYPLNANIQLLTGYLMAQQSASGNWNNSSWLTAVVYQGLHDFIPLDPTASAVKANLVSSQQPDGSWAGDPYATALILRALQLTGVAPASPTLGIIQGKIIDSQTSLPIANATVSVSGSATAASNTGEDGSFTLNGLQPGTYNLTISLANYGALTTSATVTANQTLNFGTLTLTKNAGASTGTIYGVVKDAANGTPLAGVTISGTGFSVLTNASGAYQVINVTTGDVSISATLPGYLTISTAGHIYAGGTVLYSPQLSTSATTVTASTVTGTIMDAATNLPLAGVTISVTDGVGTHAITSAADGKFSAINLVKDTKGGVSFAFSIARYVSTNTYAIIDGIPSVGIGQIRMRKATTTQLLPDLKVTSASRMKAVTDPQSLVVSGNVIATLANVGNAPVTTDVEVMAFYDVNGNGAYDAGVDAILGKIVLSGGIVQGASQAVSIPVAGSLPFRDAPIQVWADSKNAVIESDKSNNIRSTAFATELLPNLAGFDAVLKWRWSGSTVLPTFKHVEMTPVVAPLYDSNGDGIIDKLDMPNVAFLSYEDASAPFSTPGVLRIINGKDGAEILSISNPLYRLEAFSSLAIADLDGSGHPAIIAVRSPSVGGGLIAFNADGTVKWISQRTNVEKNYAFGWGGITIVDLDGDGKAEVVYGNEVFNYDGTLRWTGTANFFGQSVRWGATISAALTIVADINKDGNPLVIAGASAYDKNGTLLWKNDNVGDGFAAVGNFTGDVYPQIVIVNNNGLYLLDRKGAIIWGPVAIPGGFGGAPTIADMDGDGIPEIGVAGARQYNAFRGDGSVLWSNPTQDISSAVTGSTVFDFAGNGHASVLYGDETTLRVYNGQNGQVLFSAPNSSSTAVEYPVVADVDNDGHADFLVVSGDYGGVTTTHGVSAYQGRNNDWVNTRALWNQYTYHITNINDDGSVPKAEDYSWEKSNTYRANRSTHLYSCVAPTALLTESFSDATLAGWTPLNGRGSNAGTVVNSQYQRSGAGASTKGSMAWTDYTAEIKVKFPNGAANDAGLAFRVKGADQWYGLSVQSNSLNLVQYNQGTFTILQQASVQLPVDPTLFHSLKVEVVGTTVKGYLNGNLLINFTGLAWLQGSVGTQQDNVTALYDDLTVTSYAPPYSQDVSASFLRIVDGGSNALNFTARIGNSGSLNVPSGMSIAFYIVDPISGQQTLIGTAATKSLLLPGQYEDVTYSYAYTGQPSAAPQLVVVADDDGTGKGGIAECDETNNRISMNLSNLPGSFGLTVSTAIPVIGATSDLPLSALISNSGSFDGVANIRFVIQTPQGDQVAVLPTQSVTVPHGGQQAANAAWNTGAILAGAYVIKAQLVDANGVAYAESSAAFSITTSATTLTTKISSDKQTYQPSEVVKLSDRLTNVATNALINDLHIATTVNNPDGSLRFTANETLPQLAQGNLKDYSYSVPLSFGKAGQYSATLVVTTAAGAPVAQSSTQFTVSSSATTGSGLSGTMSVAQKLVPQGDAVAFNFSAGNAGNSILTNLPLTVNIVDPDAQKVMATYPYTPTLAIGGNYTAGASWTTTGAVGTNYVVVLAATISGKSITLAQDTFKLAAPTAAPIKLGITQAAAAGSRVLVLASCNDGDSDTDSSGHPAACITQRTQTIGNVLTALGTPYLITTDEAAFKQAMRSGVYNTYWISGKEDKLHDDTAGEVREAVYGGDGIVLEGIHDQRNKTLTAVGGITWKGKIGETDLSIVTTGTVFTTQHLVTSGRAIKPELNGGVQQAAFDGSKNHTDGPAIISNNYGAARAITFAFDLVSSMQVQPGWTPMLGTSLAYVAPAQSTALAPGALLPVKTSVANQADATDIEVKTTLPSDAAVLGSSPTGTTNAAANTLTWALNLPKAQTTDLLLSMRVPSTTGSFTLQTAVSTVKSGTATPYGNAIAFPFTVTAAVKTSTDTIAALNALVLTQKQDQQLRTSLVSQLQSAMTSFQQNTAAGYDAAISKLIQVTDQLGGLTSVNTMAVHLGVDRILKEAQWRWAQMPAAAIH
jgi:hypothetical protein